MTRIAVDLELLDELVGRLAAFEHRLESVCDDVEARMARLGASWRGVASSEHADAERRWSAGARDMHAAATALREVVATSRANYLAAVSANLQMWAS